MLNSQTSISLPPGLVLTVSSSVLFTTLQVKASGLSRASSLHVMLGSLLVKAFLYTEGRKPGDGQLPTRDTSGIRPGLCVLRMYLIVGGKHFLLDFIEWLKGASSRPGLFWIFLFVCFAFKL